MLNGVICVRARIRHFFAQTRSETHVDTDTVEIDASELVGHGGAEGVAVRDTVSSHTGAVGEAEAYLRGLM